MSLITVTIEKIVVEAGNSSEINTKLDKIIQLLTDDPTGEVKAKIVSSLDSAIDKVKNIVTP